MPKFSFSEHLIRGWQGQFERIERWLTRLRRVRDNKKNIHDQIDFLWAFFLNCYHLRDYLKLTSDIPESSLNQLFEQHLTMRIVRDLANGFKHLLLTRVPEDPRFSVGLEYNYFECELGGESICWDVDVNGQKFDLFDLAEEAVRIWRDFLEENSLLENVAV